MTVPELKPGPIPQTGCCPPVQCLLKAYYLQKAIVLGSVVSLGPSFYLQTSNKINAHWCRYPILVETCPNSDFVDCILGRFPNYPEFVDYVAPTMRLLQYNGWTHCSTTGSELSIVAALFRCQKAIFGALIFGDQVGIDLVVAIRRLTFHSTIPVFCWPFDSNSRPVVELRYWYGDDVPDIAIRRPWRKNFPPPFDPFVIVDDWWCWPHLMSFIVVVSFGPIQWGLDPFIDIIGIRWWEYMTRIVIPWRRTIQIVVFNCVGGIQ